MKKNPPEKYATETKVATPPYSKDEPTQPSTGYYLPKPGRTKIKGTGAATKGLTFGKNG